MFQCNGETKGQRSFSQEELWRATSEISHELASSFNGISMYTELLSKPEAAMSSGRSSRSTLYAALENVKSDIRTLQAISRLEAGLYRPYVKPAPVQSVLNALQEHALKTGVEALEVCQSSKFIICDHSLLDILVTEIFKVAMARSPTSLLVGTRCRADSYVIQLFAKTVDEVPGKSLYASSEFCNAHAVVAKYLSGYLKIPLLVRQLENCVHLYEIEVPAS